MGIEAEHRRVVAQETAVGTAINALVPSAIIWLIDLPPPQTLFGDHPIAKDMLLASGLAIFCMTLLLTTIVRMRVRKGGLPRLYWPVEDRGAMRYLPRPLWLRAAVLAACAITLFVPAGLAAVAVLGVLPLTKTGFLIFNMVFGGIVGSVMARFVVLPALADSGREPAMAGPGPGPRSAA